MFKKYYMEKPFEEMFPGSREYSSSLDENGVVVMEYPRRGLGKQHNPVAIMMYALSQYNLFFDTRKEEHKKSFLAHADYLVVNLVEKGSFGVWYYNFKWVSPGYFCLPPWISSMAQGLGLSVLVRAYDLTKDGKYLGTAKKALATFEVPVADGGVFYVDRRGDVWYEEYACEKRAQVLNGFIFALLGVHEMHECTGDKKARDIFDKGVQTLKKRVGDFDLNLGFFKSTKYDNKLLIYAGDKYHKAHIEQMDVLYKITKDEIFREYRDKWNEYQRLSRSGVRSMAKALFTRVYFAYVYILKITMRQG